MSKRNGQHGAVLFGLAGGMLVLAGGLAGGYYVVSTRSEAAAATRPAAPVVTDKATPAVHSGASTPALDALLKRPVQLKTGSGTTTLTWGELGVEVDPDELGRAGAAATDADLATLGAKGSIPVRLDRDKGTKALIQLKSHYDKSAVDAYLDLEARTIHDDTSGQGIDVWASLPRIETSARQGAKAIDLVTVAVPARVTKTGIGIEDISNVMGHFETKFAVADRDRNFNLKLAASKINGYVLKPGETWSFNDTVGERSQATGYKIAHVITAGEMVDGLAGGTCQISTTLFGASFFAGLDIVKRLNHSRPSTYTPLGFDATVVWPNTDLVLKNPYEFPVAIHYVVANGEAKVEILGKPRPFTKIEFARQLMEETPYSSEERLDEEMPEGETMLDQPGFNGYKLKSFRRIYQGKKMIREDKWVLTYKPVTEYIRRGTSTDPNAKKPDEKQPHVLKVPDKNEFDHDRTVLTQ